MASKNRAVKNAVNRAYYHRHKEKAYLGHRAWCEKNKEHLKRKQAEYREKNRERLRVYHREYSQKNKERARELGRLAKARNPRKYRDKDLRRLYGLSIEHYEAILAYQQNACAICRQTPIQKPHVDHCHASNIIRGILCGRCNVGIGMFGDDAARLRAASVYLDEHYAVARP